jgi:tripartite-type tricarboxylate transporter receptor subunit TctC
MPWLTLVRHDKMIVTQRKLATARTARAYRSGPPTFPPCFTPSDESKGRAMTQVIVSFAALLAAIAPAIAQDWPTRPLTMVVPFAAAGGADVMGRIVAARLSELLGQQVIVENVGGAGGMIGASRVAKAPPDGYQFVFGSSGTHAVNQTLYKNPLYNAATDFAPVVLISELPLVLVARKDLPANSLPEFITYAKANQMNMQFSSSGVGSTNHLACALLNSAIGINVTHVPYRGAAPAMQDLIAGRIDYGCFEPPITAPLVEIKTVKAIAVLTKNRSPKLPNLGSAHEQALEDFEAYSWYATFLPKGTPAPIVQKLHGATVAAMTTPSVQAKLQEIGATIVAPERRTPEYLAKFVVSEIAKWVAPIRASNIQIE